MKTRQIVKKTSTLSWLLNAHPCSVIIVTIIIIIALLIHVIRLTSHYETCQKRENRVSRRVKKNVDICLSLKHTVFATLLAWNASATYTQLIPAFSLKICWTSIQSTSVCAYISVLRVIIKNGRTRIKSRSYVTIVFTWVPFKFIASQAQR